MNFENLVAVLSAEYPDVLADLTANHADLFPAQKIDGIKAKAFKVDASSILRKRAALQNLWGKNANTKYFKTTGFKRD